MNKDKHWLSNEITNLAGSAFFREENEPVVNVIELRKLVEQLDEPKLPVIPQFIADWIKECKAYENNLFGVYNFAPDVVSAWIFENESKKERVDLIARAWLDGFVVNGDKEVWRVIDGCHNEVSNLGRVRSLDHMAGNGKNYKGKMLKPIITNSGYINVSIIDKKKGKIAKRLHRLVAEAFIPNFEKLPEINHINGDKENNNAENLEWVTRSENQQHAYDNGLQIPAKGSQKPASKLKEEDVINIRKEYQEGCIQIELAEKYGVARQTISSIVNMKAWKHVAEEVQNEQ